MDTIKEIEKKLFSRPLADIVANLEQDQRLRRAWQLIERDYADPDLDLQQAARESGASKNHLNLLMRQTTGFTFHQLVIRYRLLRAIATLKDRNHNLLEVALSSGFGSLGGLERNSHTLLGVAPVHLRHLVLAEQFGISDET
ncbi:MAG: AraC family transcriptional regulator [Acidobacteriota bacterium]